MDHEETETSELNTTYQDPAETYQTNEPQPFLKDPVMTSSSTTACHHKPNQDQVIDLNNPPLRQL